MHEIKAIIRPQRLDDVMKALRAIAGLPGVTVSRVHAYSRPQPHDPDVAPRGLEADLIKLETVVPPSLVEQVVGTIRETAHTGRAGDGMVFISAVQDAIRIRSGDRRLSAL